MVGIPGTEIPSEKIRGDLNALINRSKTTDETNRVLSEQIATLQARNAELETEMEDFEIFRPILENPPTRLEVCIRSKRVAMELEGRVKNMYKKGAGSDDSEDPEQRRRWRAKLDIVALACIKTGLDSWDRTYARYLSKAVATR